MARAYVAYGPVGAKPVAASAEADKVINKPKTKTDRIAFAPFSVYARGLSADHVRIGGHYPKP